VAMVGDPENRLKTIAAKEARGQLGIIEEIS
jgi:hypothetical protein